MIYLRGGSYTRFGEIYHQGLLDLADEVVDELIKQGLKLEKIEALVVGNMFSQLLDNQSQLGAILTKRWGLAIPALRVEAACASGGAAVWTAINLLKSGEYKNILVIGVEKMTDYPTPKITQALTTAGDGQTDVVYQISFPASYALYANYWLYKGWISQETLFHIAAKNHYYGSLNPKAQFRRPLKKEEYYQSNLVAYPLRLFDCSPISDGAAAIWLSRSPGQRSPFLLGAELATGANSPQLNPHLNGLPASKQAAKRLFSQTRIKPHQIDIAEVQDCFTIAEAMAITDLGLIKKEQLAEFYSTYWKEKKPPQGYPHINTSGGLKACGHPIGATGVKQVAEIYLQLSHQAGGRQVKEAEIGLTHNVGGSGGTVFLSLWQGGKDE